MTPDPPELDIDPLAGLVRRTDTCSIRSLAIFCRLGGRGRGRLPDHRQVGGQRADRRARRRSRGGPGPPAPSLVLVLDLPLRLQGVLPPPFQLAGHQPVLRLARLVLTRRRSASNRARSRRSCQCRASSARSRSTSATAARLASKAAGSTAARICPRPSRQAAARKGTGRAARRSIADPRSSYSRDDPCPGYRTIIRRPHRPHRNRPASSDGPCRDAPGRSRLARLASRRS